MNNDLQMCEWCGEVTNDTEEFEGYTVCKKCVEAYRSCTCRECGCMTEQNSMYKGLCIECAQEEIAESMEYKEFVENDISGLEKDEAITDKQYDTILRKGVIRNSIGPDELKNNPVLRTVFIMVKATASKSGTSKDIDDNMSYLDKLVLDNIDTIIGADTKIALADKNGVFPEYKGYNEAARNGKCALYVRE